jgi:hypothetical protein
MRATALLLAVAAGISPAAYAAVYTCTDPDGRTVFRDVPCTRGERHADLTTAAPKSAPRKRKQASASGTEPALDQKKVQRLVARLDQAMGKRNAKAVVAMLAEDAVVEVPADRAGTPSELDRSGYERYLAGVFDATDYVYRAAPARVSVAKAKPRASVVRTVQETAWINGRRAVIEVKERLTIEPQGRGLRIRALRKQIPMPAR